MSTTMASFSPLTRFSSTHSSHSKPHLITHNNSNSNKFFTLALRPKNFTLKAASADSAETAVKPPPEDISVGTNGSASAVAAAEEVKVVPPSGFVDPRWVGGTWDLMQFRKNGTTDWDAVIDAGNLTSSFASKFQLQFPFIVL